MSFGKKSSSPPPAPTPVTTAVTELQNKPIPAGVISRTANDRATANEGSALLNTETEEQRAQRMAAGGLMTG